MVRNPVRRQISQTQAKATLPAPRRDRFRNRLAHSRLHRPQHHQHQARLPQLRPHLLRVRRQHQRLRPNHPRLLPHHRRPPSRLGHRTQPPTNLPKKPQHHLRPPRPLPNLLPRPNQKHQPSPRPNPHRKQPTRSRLGNAIFTAARDSRRTANAACITSNQPPTSPIPKR